MIKTLKRLTVTLMLAVTTGTALAQYYSGEHTYDGENRNEASASVTTGLNTAFRQPSSKRAL